MKPLKLSCNNLALKYYVKQKADPTNLAHYCTFRRKCKTLFQQKEKAIKTFGLWMESIYLVANTYNKNPWNIGFQNTSLEYNDLKNIKTHPLTYQDKFQKIKKISWLYIKLHRWIKN